jgi:hypothetical protein
MSTDGTSRRSLRRNDFVGYLGKADIDQQLVEQSRFYEYTP